MTSHTEVLMLTVEGAQSWCSVTAWRDGVGREGGRDFRKEETHIGIWQIHVDVWQKPSQYCKVSERK